MLTLKGAGFVESKRGKSGGFYLMKSPEEITVGDIICVIEGPAEPIACIEKGKENTCADTNTCAFREIWTEVARAVSRILDSATFAGLMQRTRELQKSQTDYDYQI